VPTLAPTGGHCKEVGSVITCTSRKKSSKQRQERCSSDPTAAVCIANGAACPEGLSGVRAENRHSVDFVCEDEIWRHVQKSVSSGES
jgi:hypothetical protein